MRSNRKCSRCRCIGHTKLTCPKTGDNQPTGFSTPQLSQDKRTIKKTKIGKSSGFSSMGLPIPFTSLNSISPIKGDNVPASKFDDNLLKTPVADVPASEFDDNVLKTPVPVPVSHLTLKRKRSTETKTRVLNTPPSLMPYSVQSKKSRSKKTESGVFNTSSIPRSLLLKPKTLNPQKNLE